MLSLCKRPSRVRLLVSHFFLPSAQTQHVAPRILECVTRLFRDKLSRRKFSVVAFQKKRTVLVSLATHRVLNDKKTRLSLPASIFEDFWLRSALFQRASTSRPSHYLRGVLEFLEHIFCAGRYGRSSAPSAAGADFLLDVMPTIFEIMVRVSKF